jgi:hypothetical protein
MKLIPKLKKLNPAPMPFGMIKNQSCVASPYANHNSPFPMFAISIGLWRLEESLRLNTFANVVRGLT